MVGLVSQKPGRITETARDYEAQNVEQFRSSTDMLVSPINLAKSLWSSFADILNWDTILHHLSHTFSLVVSHLRQEVAPGIVGRYVPP